VLDVPPEVVPVLVEDFHFPVQAAQLVPLTQDGADRRLGGRLEQAGAQLLTVLALMQVCWAVRASKDFYSVIEHGITENRITKIKISKRRVN
jgi:hypothetical protein